MRAAGELAEREWRIKEGMVGVPGLDEAVGRADGRTEWVSRALKGEWTMQEVVNYVVDGLVVVES